MKAGRVSAQDALREAKEHPPKYRLTRGVTREECHWLPRDFFEGEILEQGSGPYYGCISYAGIALAEEGLGGFPWYEFPQAAVEVVR